MPFLVQAQDRAKLLVVTPTLSWLGVDKVDDDSDGLPNTLETGGPVEWPRVINGAQGIPPAFAAETAPLLVFLDRARIRYDLTSDIALARSRDPRATDREGVILAGSLRWVPRPLARRLRRYVDAGGRLASFGTESLRRGVRIGSRRLTQPTQPTPTDPFGARLEPVANPRTEDDGRTPLPLTALAEEPRLGLLTGSDGVIPAFGRLEESVARPRDARRQGADRARPGRQRQRARQGRGRRRAAARGAAGADRDTARQGRRDPRRAHAVGAARGHGRRGRADHAQHRRHPAPRQAEGALGGRLTIPSSAIRSGATASSSSGVSVSAARSDAAASSSASSSVVLRPPVPELRARVAGEQRAGEEELERVQDRHGRRRARQLHPLGLTHRRAGGDGRHHARQRQPRRIDRDDPLRAQQLAHRLLEMEALERLGQQQDEERLVHRRPDAIASALVADVDDLVFELRAPEGDPAGAIVLLHGRGTSEQDLIPLLDVFDPQERLVGAFPRGPLQLPPIGSHWYVVEEVGYPDPESFRATFQRLGVVARGPGGAHRRPDRAHRARRLLPGRGDGVGAGARPRPPAARRASSP